MNVSKSSWHYRLLDKMDLLAWQHETLCKYFWKVMFTAVLLPLVALGVSFVGTIPLWWSFVEGDLVYLAAFIGAIEVVILTCWLGSTVAERWEREIAEGTREKPVKVYKPKSLFSQWLKAKHEQVCPIIDFVDES